MAAFAALILVAAGCSRQTEPIFEEHDPAITWPPVTAKAATDAAVPARVRYVGQLKSSADLKPPPKLFQAIGDLLAGAKQPQTLYGPRSVIRSPDGERLWVADPGGRCLHMFNLQSRVYAKIENSGNDASRFTSDASRLVSPVSLCLGPDDSMYVCDSEVVAIHRRSLIDGQLIESLRLPEDVVQRPVAVYYDLAAGELFVVDVNSHDIKVLDADGRLLRIIGRRGSGPGEFNYPCDIVGDGEMIWIADTGNCRVQGLTRAGEPVTTIGQAGDAPGDLAMPKGLALDSDGHIFVVDARFENVQIFDRAGRLLLFFGAEGNGPGEFWLPSGICIDQTDRIWICDSYNRRVQVFDYLKKPKAGKPDPSPERKRVGPHTRDTRADVEKHPDPRTADGNPQSPIRNPQSRIHNPPEVPT